ncbi:hypothetical protein Patl1_32677 [Pistacia atlantica]|uniref:Uncharacterized protein n=1 Tax=Pistacia atlantica TaxID=434234 RepID=A0ACC1APZ4_9ROSI|nr:hypothetical protein Patl1_32677 [Pistacia atlantica]
MSTSRRKLLLNTVSVSLGCSSCKKPKLSFLFHPKPKSKHHSHSLYSNHSLYFSSSTTSSCKTNATEYDTASATTFSPKTWKTDETDIPQAQEDRFQNCTRIWSCRRPKPGG